MSEERVQEYHDRKDYVNWSVMAECRGLDTDMFFPDKGKMPSAEAIGACRVCKVRVHCLNYALRHNLDYGMWGGLTPAQRRGMRRHHVAS